MARTLYDLAGAEEERRFSPYCWRVKMALAHKGLAYQTVPWRFTEKPAIAFSSQGLVPVLVDGERVVTDSWSICQYLESTYPDSPPLAEGPQAWAHAFFLKNWAERSLQTALSPLVYLDILAHVHPKDREYFRSSREARVGTTLEAFTQDRPAHLAKLRNVLEPLKATLAAQPFLSGTGPALGDYLVFGAFQWARCISEVQLLEPESPIYLWRERMLALYGGLAARSLGYPTRNTEVHG
ncbi:MAG: glutathione S-transferase family protein [Myxococcaceae bacterium]